MSPEPVELSAHPKTPGYMAAQPVSNTARPPNTDSLNVFGTAPSKKRVTQATVNGPVNVPDFETVRKHSHPGSNKSRGPSPQIPFMPQQILKRGASRASSEATAILPKAASQSAAKTPSAPQAAFKPQILKRPQQEQPPPPQNAMLAPVPTQTAHTKGLLDMFKGPSLQPAAAQLSHSAVLPAGHKQGLLDMFKGPSPQPTSAQPSRSPAPPTGHTQGLLDMFKGSSPQPPPAQTSLTQPRLPPALPAEHKQDLLNMFKSPSPQPPLPAQPTTDSPLDPKPNLLALFSKPSPQPKANARAQPPPLQPLRSPAPGAFPHLTKRTDSLSGFVSPISPGNGGTSPASTGDRRRDGGVGLLGAGASSGAGTSSLRGGISADGGGGKSPVDKTFLLGLLENVARTG